LDEPKLTIVVSFLENSLPSFKILPNSSTKFPVAYKTLQKIYDAIEEHHKDQDKLDLIASHLSNIVRSPIKLTIENALEFMLSNK
jgi:hypothetical protein